MNHQYLIKKRVRFINKNRSICFYLDKNNKVVFVKRFSQKLESFEPFTTKQEAIDFVKDLRNKATTKSNFWKGEKIEITYDLETVSYMYDYLAYLDYERRKQQ